MLTYISAKISKSFEDMMFQIAALYVNSKKFNKIITIPEQTAFIKDYKMFNTTPITDYYELSDRSDAHTIVPFDKNIMLVGKFKSFKCYDDDCLEFMRHFIYSNEDYMYSAYNRYNEIKQTLSANDDEIVSLYMDDETNLGYYKKALILANIKNVVVFTSKKELPDAMKELFADYNVQLVWDSNTYVRFVLLSMFRHNICQYYDPFYCTWAAYISKYDQIKTVIVPDYLKKVINENVNNFNILYLD